MLAIPTVLEYGDLEEMLHLLSRHLHDESSAYALVEAVHECGPAGR